jgi:small Trp-rich protein
MILVWAGLALVVLKLLEIGPVAEWAWWWVLAPFALGLVWFEWGEKLLGLDRQSTDQDVHELRRKERVAGQFRDKSAAASKRSKDKSR